MARARRNNGKLKFFDSGSEPETWAGVEYNVLRGVVSGLRSILRHRVVGAIIMNKQRRLPTHFPIGTHYILEGEPASNGEVRITSRYVLMPDGVRYNLMSPHKRMRKPAAARKASPGGCIRSLRRPG
jgi:hypothetical protein